MSVHDAVGVGDSTGHEEEVCSLCLEPALDFACGREPTGKITILSCGHTLHESCLMEFAKSVDANKSASALTCPLCRTPIHEDEAIGVDSARLTKDSWDSITSSLFEILRHRTPTAKAVGPPAAAPTSLLAHKFSTLDFFEGNSSLQRPKVPKGLVPMMASREARVTLQNIISAIETMPGMSCSPAVKKRSGCSAVTIHRCSDTRKSGTTKCKRPSRTYSFTCTHDRAQGGDGEVGHAVKQPAGDGAPEPRPSVEVENTSGDAVLDILDPEDITWLGNGETSEGVNAETPGPSGSSDKSRVEGVFQDVFAVLVDLLAEGNASVPSSKPAPVATTTALSTREALDLEMGNCGENAASGTTTDEAAPDFKTRNSLAALLFLRMMQSVDPVVLREPVKLNALQSAQAWTRGKKGWSLVVLTVTWFVFFLVGLLHSIGII